MSNKYTLKRKLTLKVVNTISVYTGRGYHLATNNTHTHTHGLLPGTSHIEVAQRSPRPQLQWKVVKGESENG